MIVQNDRILSASCYLFSLTPFYLILLVFMYASKSSDYVKFHANQALVLFVITFTCNSVIFKSLNFSSMISLLYLISILIIFWGIVNALKGKVREIPVIGKYYWIESVYKGLDTTITFISLKLKH